MGKHKKVGKYQNWDKEEDSSAVRAKKHLGQHFLKDQVVARKIAETLLLNGYDNVIEIGPGTGVLTQYLLEQDINILALDLDRESIEYLKTDFEINHLKLLQRKKSFEVRNADFLKEDLSTLFNGAPFGITGNFPYNISTQIVFKMLEYKDRVPEFTGMFQKEVAQRICEKEGSKAYGILSVLVQAFYEAEYLFTVHPEVFNPPPKVQSGVLRLTRKENQSIDCSETLLKTVVKAAFNQRRKTLRNSLKTLQLSENLTKDAIFDKRPEQISVADFIALTKKIAHDTL
ncbi:16S rRNA (adenine(1518)-N(6)/adenine(1519)-N(6))-dimethyltransferase RsmA [Flavobacteriaceae bacterium]|jgi:16S rRNA (adenine1518-N6/adenine1519-N6)-dimethyltransferase|nr:dimethyladenosine transferase [Flavobacteria bacterium MS024-3C]KRP00947.1 MAG: 16S rRNA methyltransferase [Polaribacter sp. BACL8 MAG-120619-bin41]KRP14947.1 MAG: 16S rRNA methyltransferase [Polaribacter sp. BACL8 MAG-120419-bin8]MBT4840029.1 16S rRNA (adenine(1518)-N(6)/adenine(1519)-N(6))-dimethyltransferase RsmA [Flavobacteriaceae bacterium]MDA9304254.1 16S rRNA (adenine(1518)-N(6)/adenine(1519)-N(6))-dimethyltransferase RsmA [bacterium]NQV63499.1 16S rRNA (adenine(1518)-N(6)/adenine(15|tara:strand:- start:14737 stop:15597 length:861 start_codon:yes stop_codon:yes gene_type:complete